jgi:O-antigen/teichoic acid export membrane protein
MLSQLPGKLLLNGVEALMLPALAAQARRSPQAIKEPFLRTVECVSAVYWPALLVLVILAEPIVRILYGQAWVPVTPCCKSWRWPHCPSSWASSMRRCWSQPAASVT